MVETLSANNVDFHYAGFVAQDELPVCYGNAKLLFFSALNDPWSVVANEACESARSYANTSNGFIYSVQSVESSP
ncbi:MAG: hypothetical protein ABGY96_11120 [bacterium]|nr:hypothetical protein [Gammaproteobacteria bacterium]HIL96680.1 hypothetical protein [Pseudomonadales bacterium]